MTARRLHDSQKIYRLPLVDPPVKGGTVLIWKNKLLESQPGYDICEEQF
jgi:hypothetical protein